MCSVWRSPGPDLTLTDIGRVVDNLSEFGIRYIALAGGEPLLRADLFEVFGLLERHRLLYALTTNGLLLDRHMIDRFNKHRPNNLMVSLDSLKAPVYRRLRGVDGLDAVTANIQGAGRCLDRHIVLRINTVLTPLNLEEIPALLEFAERNGAALSVTPCAMGGGFRHRHQADEVRPNTEAATAMAETMLWVAEMATEGRAVYGPTTFYETAARVLTGGAAVRCDANRFVLHVDARGGVSVCQDLPPFADLLRTSLTEAWSASTHAAAITRCCEETPCFYMCSRMISHFITHPETLTDFFRRS
ncbi:radical SAM protein [bacterium]|nr:radical SAM protein [candidate division CSSED10-310 bacterium]